MRCQPLRKQCLLNSAMKPDRMLLERIGYPCNLCEVWTLIISNPSHHVQRTTSVGSPASPSSNSSGFSPEDWEPSVGSSDSPSSDSCGSSESSESSAGSSELTSSDSSGSS